MKPIEGNIIVKVDRNQKEEAIISGNVMRTGKSYNENFRERNPVIAYVLAGTTEVPTDTWIVCNYNYFEEGSPLSINDNIFSVPVNEEIFAIVNEDGYLKPICGNVLVSRIEKYYPIDIPEDLKKNYINQGYSLSGLFKGTHIFWLPYSDYEICYSWNGIEKREIKVHESEIVGYLKE